ncbi:homoserine dehydrogenase [Candidatus Marinamargulisbacteria bacterium SCGC AG-343-D04]|nr:homoserine dehydrogenase [Candidatus Marinamargulisbacteria bacterium SCGC AG-343-D04]
MINIGLIGFGNVGKSVFDIFAENGDLISNRIGQPIHIKKIAVRSIEKYSSQVPDPSLLTDSVDDILQDPDIDIVVEVMGGDQPAYNFITQALTHKKHVVTANKEVVSKHKRHFFQCAKEHGVDIYFEAAVGGGIPIIRSLKVGFSANNITAFYGIVNGTTNYILTKIQEEGKDFNTVLKTAQELGFAEADPTMDISGLDAAYKCVILAAVAFKIDVQLDSVYYEGIESISLKDIQYADELGFRIKLLAIGNRIDPDTFSLHVHPTLIPKEHPLSSVRNEFNATYIVGDQVGESMLMGKGAGGSPTASAVISDIIDISFNLSQSVSYRNLETRFSDAQVQSFDAHECQVYFRLSVKNTPGVLEQVSLQFSKHSISIEKIIQKEMIDDRADVVIITSPMSESTSRLLQENILSLDSCHQISSVLRLIKSF